MGPEDQPDSFRTNVVLVAVVGSLAFAGVVMSRTMTNVLDRKSRAPRRRNEVCVLQVTIRQI